MFIVILMIFSYPCAATAEKTEVNCAAVIIHGATIQDVTNINGDDIAAEGDLITYLCVANHTGRRPASLVWYNDKKEKVSPLTNGKTGLLHTHLNRTATAPKISTLICVMCEWNSKEQCIAGNQCSTKDYKTLYSVRTVATWPLLYASPGEKFTCKAAGNPKPKYSWKRKENGGGWMDAGEGNNATAKLSANSTSASYKCVATNTVRGRQYTKESAEIEVTEGGAKKRWIIIGVVIGVVVLLAIIGAIVFFVMK